MYFRSLLSLSVLIALAAGCSTITKKDCSTDMMKLGLTQGKAGSPKKYTDDLRSTCMGSHPNIDLEAYEKGFYQGWSEYCTPNKAFDMGKKSDRYFSFCPLDREKQFRAKYLIGKHHAELKDIEEELVEKMEENKPGPNATTSVLDLQNKLRLELEKVRRDIHALEVEGLSSKFSL